MFDFQNLEIYKKAKTFHINSLQIIQSNNFDKIVKDQLYRASLSIVLNIAEGSGRFSKADRRNFFVIARSSVFECVAIVDTMHDKKEISNYIFTEYLSAADEISRMLYAMIKNLS